ncbi:ATP-binding cassette domain-containing protein [Mumia sp. ZJ1417]|uniref:ATP-binding cassette domain-containing protein n=1 Tax=unclassified Mumia TaxID=2621872 RepID=UPI001422079B|nr:MULTISPECIES: ATP-binding cassette domain-containing protein [unclassified Mumia]QMW66664.1 ATP-binding cassette domain-containing protein [Mumia sp. ZJ1417]
MTYTVEVADLTKSYGSTEVLRGVDLAIAPGTVHGLLGANGAGKTTLVRILATLIGYDGGTARVAGHDVSREPYSVRGAISLTGQYAAVDEVLTARENLTMVARLRRLSRIESAARTDELLARFDLGTIADRRATTYSGGQRRRLDLAMSMVVPPTLLFLDEPTTGLDPRSRDQVWATVRELADTGVTVLLTTQYLEEADQLADRISVLDGGLIVAEGTPEELKTQVAGEVVRLSYGDGARYEAARAALRTTEVTADPVLLTLDVPSNGTPDSLRVLLDTLAAADALPHRVGMHAPSLDDVFLTLTAPTLEAHR